MSESKRKVLITGAAGNLGGYLGCQWQDRYDLRLTDIRNLDYPLKKNTDFQKLDISKLEDMQMACKGMDTVVHLAADPSQKADFYDTLLACNVIGVYNIYRAAADQGCRRVIYASSVNAINGYPDGMRVTPKSAPNPLYVYGSCKVFGEALAQSFFHMHRLSSLCIRFGGIVEKAPENDPIKRANWITLGDSAHLIEQCIEVDGIDFAIAHGFSRHYQCQYDIRQTCKLLGYTPKDGTAYMKLKFQQRISLFLLDSFCWLRKN